MSKTIWSGDWMKSDIYHFTVAHVLWQVLVDLAFLCTSVSETHHCVLKERFVKCGRQSCLRAEVQHMKVSASLRSSGSHQSWVFSYLWLLHINNTYTALCENSKSDVHHILISPSLKHTFVIHETVNMFDLTHIYFSMALHSSSTVVSTLFELHSASLLHCSVQLSVL